MPKFEKKYVHILYSDDLEGKRGWCADNVGYLIDLVVDGCDSKRVQVSPCNSPSFPFVTESGNGYRFFYYDPFFDLLNALDAGKAVQRYDNEREEWFEVDELDTNSDPDDYRIKPESKPVTKRELAQGNGESCLVNERMNKMLSRDYYQFTFGWKTRSTESTIVSKSGVPYVNMTLRQFINECNNVAELMECNIFRVTHEDGTDITEEYLQRDEEWVKRQCGGNK